MTYELSLYVRAVDDVFGMQLSVLLFQDVEDRFLAMDLKDLGLVVLVTAAAGTTAAETIRALPTPITSPPSSMNQTAASTKTTSMVHLLVTTAEEDTLMM